jgi:hypothetical protein
MVSACAPSFIPSFNSSNSSHRTPITPSQKTAWQRAVWNSNLPCAVKGFLLNLSVGWMDAEGGSCFPSEEQMMARLGCSRPALTRWIRIAVKAGFLRCWHYGRGIRNRRYNYQATFPSVPSNEIGTNLSDPVGGIGTNPSDHEPCPNDNHEKRESDPEPAPPEPTASTIPPVGAHSDFASQQEPEPVHAPEPPKAQVIPLPSKTALPDDWQLPDDYREWASQHRPDLADRLDAIATNFHDFHLSKGTRSASWIAEWRRWINRERSPKTAVQRPQPPKAVNPYAHLDMPKKPLDLAMEAALEIRYEERRIAMLIKNGIDPATGLKVAPPTVVMASSSPMAASSGYMPMPITAQPHTREQQIRIIELAASGMTLAEAKRRVAGDNG